MNDLSLPAWRMLLARSRAWISILLIAPVAVAAMFSRPHLMFTGAPEYAVELVAWILFICGAVLRWWATLFIGGRKDRELITEGPYSICRNPLYLGTFCMTLSVAVFSQSVTLVAVTLLVSMMYLVITVPVEEHRLAGLYGERFADYTQRVPRFFPNPFLYSAPAELTIRLTGLRAEARRMLQWMWIPCLCYLAEHVRMLPWWPTPVWLP
jgi:protein-S-isoprenylcysteine O-methyltransferase Ste14